MRLSLSPSLSLPNAAACLQASAAAYAQATFETAKAHVLVVPYDNATILAFRGSQSPRDFVLDAEVWRSSAGANNIEVHHGFYDAFSSIAGELLDRATLGDFTRRPAAQNLQPATCNLQQPIFITGHSLGGALALLAAKTLFGFGLPIQAVYTFGQPRVGNAAFALSYDAQGPGGASGLADRTYRFVNQDDIVPLLPGLLVGYRHVGQEVFLPTAGGLVLNRPLWRAALTVATGTYRLWKNGPLNQLARHYATTYNSALAPLLPSSAQSDPSDSPTLAHA